MSELYRMHCMKTLSSSTCTVCTVWLHLTVWEHSMKSLYCMRLWSFGLNDFHEVTKFQISMETLGTTDCPQRASTIRGSQISTFQMAREFFIVHSYIVQGSLSRILHETECFKNLAMRDALRRPLDKLPLDTSRKEDCRNAHQSTYVWQYYT